MHIIVEESLFSAGNKQTQRPASHLCSDFNFYIKLIFAFINPVTPVKDQESE